MADVGERMEMSEQKDWQPIETSPEGREVWTKIGRLHGHHCTGSHGRAGMKGAELIAAERHRQVTQLGWSAAHDDSHRCGELVVAAIRYATQDLRRPKLRILAARSWPWAREWWKPSVITERNLVKAGALIAAEIDRLQRLAARGGDQP